MEMFAEGLYDIGQGGDGGGAIVSQQRCRQQQYELS